MDAPPGVSLLWRREIMSLEKYRRKNSDGSWELEGKDDWANYSYQCGSFSVRLTVVSICQSLQCSWRSIYSGTISGKKNHCRMQIVSCVHTLVICILPTLNLRMVKEGRTGQGSQASVSRKIFNSSRRALWKWEQRTGNNGVNSRVAYRCTSTASPIKLTITDTSLYGPQDLL